MLEISWRSSVGLREAMCFSSLAMVQRRTTRTGWCCCGYMKTSQLRKRKRRVMSAGVKVWASM